MHDTQIGILNKLLFKKGCRYSDLKIDSKIENNTFQFHLNKVIKQGLVRKDGTGTYSLTKKGKKIANHIDVENNIIVERQKLSVHLYCTRQGDSGKETLMYTRKKHPFYNMQGFPTGKILLGEEFVQAAKRELKEETNLDGEPVLFNIVHYLVKDKQTKELLDDKIFLDFFIKDPNGKLLPNEEGEYKWVKISEIEKCILRPFYDIETYKVAFKRIEHFKGVVNIEEFNHFTDKF